MKKILFRGIILYLCLIIPSPNLIKSMPSSEEDEQSPTSPPASSTSKNSDKDNEAKTNKSNQDSKSKIASSTETTNTKPKALTWPETTEVSEDNKTLLQSNNKEIVQIFTQAQEVCKNMDDTLSHLNTQRDAANKKYRDTIQEFEPLLQRIGAARAENKNRKEIS